MTNQGTSFTVTKELALSSDIVLSCWCPTMDLCAVVSSDGQLQLHRMDWQQLWAISPEALVSALCWRPDGKQLAAGHVNGALSVLDVETDLSLLTSLSEEALPHPYDLCMEAWGAPAWPVERAGLSLLCAGDARGHISLWLHGQVQIAEVSAAVPNINPGCDDEDTSYQLLHVVADSDLQQLLVISRSLQGRLVVTCHSLDVLHKHHRPLQQCTSLFSHIQKLLQAALQCVDKCNQEWSSVHADFTKRFVAQLQQELADQGSSITEPQQELLLLLATGACTPPLHNFLSSSLGEAGLRRLARSTDAALGALHTVLLERLMPLAELVLFLLGELRGAVLAAGAGSWMGLQVDSIQQLELQAAALLLRSEQLRRVVTSTACQYRSFCSWLLRCIQRLELSQDATSTVDASTPLAQCQEVVTFLKGQFMHDVIGPELSGAKLEPAAQRRAEVRMYQGIPAAESHQLLAMMLPICPQPGQQQAVHQPQGCLGSLAGAGDAHLVREAAAACSRALAHQLQHLVGEAEAAFELPAMHISPSIRPPHQVLLLMEAAEAALATAAAGSVISPVISPSTTTPAAHTAVASDRVTCAPPLLQSQQCLDLHTHITCMAAGSVPAAGREPPDLQPHHTQQPSLLLTRLQESSSCKGRSCSTPRIMCEALLLRLPAATFPTSWALYKEQQLALVLYQPTTSGSPGVLSPHRFPGASSSHTTGSSTLYLIDLSEAPWAAVQPAWLHPQQGIEQQQQHDEVADSSVSVLQQCAALSAEVMLADLPARCRVLPQGPAGQLAVSRARGLGSLVTDLQYLLLLDLEEDDEAGEDDSMAGADEDNDDDDMQQ